MLTDTLSIPELIQIVVLTIAALVKGVLVIDSQEDRQVVRFAWDAPVSQDAIELADDMAARDVDKLILLLLLLGVGCWAGLARPNFPIVLESWVTPMVLSSAGVISVRSSLRSRRVRKRAMRRAGITLQPWHRVVWRWATRRWRNRCEVPRPQ